MTNFTTPVGRIVAGNLYTPNTKNAEGKPLVDKAGNPRNEFFFAVAIVFSFFCVVGRIVTVVLNVVVCGFIVFSAFAIISLIFVCGIFSVVVFVVSRTGF